MFVHRNVGNMIPGNDLNALSVLEFAVTNLDVTDIIVTGTNSHPKHTDPSCTIYYLYFAYPALVALTGHYDCGAIRAATKRQDLGLLENWLRQIRDIYRLHQPYLDEFTVRTLYVVRCWLIVLARVGARS